MSYVRPDSPRGAVASMPCALSYLLALQTCLRSSHTGTGVAPGLGVACVASPHGPVRPWLTRPNPKGRVPQSRSVHRASPNPAFASVRPRLRTAHFLPATWSPLLPGKWNLRHETEARGAQMRRGGTEPSLQTKASAPPKSPWSQLINYDQ